MFTWLNKQGVASSDGFTVQSMHRYYWHYIEGEHIMKIVVEPCRNPETQQYFEEVSERSFGKWLSPFDAEVVSAEKIAQIKKNFSDALTFMDIPQRFVEHL